VSSQVKCECEVEKHFVAVSQFTESCVSDRSIKILRLQFNKLYFLVLQNKY